MKKKHSEFIDYPIELLQYKSEVEVEGAEVEDVAISGLVKNTPSSLPH